MVADVAGVYMIRLCDWPGWPVKAYIGSSVAIKARLKEHRRMLSRGTHHSKHLQRAWNKVGNSRRWEFLAVGRFDSTQRRLEAETYLIQRYGHFNGTPYAGPRYQLGYRHSAATRAKIAASSRARKITGCDRIKISVGKLGHLTSTETRLKMSAAKKGKAPWNKGRRKCPTL